MKQFTTKVKEIIDIVYQEEYEKIKEAAILIFNSIKDKGILHVFATGHSHMLAEEMFYRAGGLVAIDPVLRPFLMQHEGAISSTKFERLPGIAKIVFDGLDKKIDVGRYHSWVIDAKSLKGTDLEITATSNEGQVMAIRHKTYDIRGIQFHPESVLTPDGKTMINNWLKH